MEKLSHGRMATFYVAYILAIYLIVPLLAPYFSRLGYTDSQIGFIFSLFSLTIIVGGVLVHTLADRFGQHRVTSVALLLQIVAYVLYVFASPFSIVLGRVIDALCYCIITVLLISTIEHRLHEKHRGKYTGWVLSVQHAARLIAPFIGGVLADRFLGLPFIFSGIIFLVLAYVVYSHDERPKNATARFTPFASIGLLWHDQELRAITTMSVVIGLTLPIATMTVPLFVTKSLGLSYTEVGIALMAGAAGYLFQFFFGGMADWIGRERLMIAAVLWQSVLFVIIGLYVRTYHELLVALVLLGFGGAAYNVSSFSAFAEAAKRNENAAIGAYYSVSKIGDTLAFAVSGLVAATFGYSGSFAVAGVALFIGALVTTALLLRIRYSPLRA